MSEFTYVNAQGQPLNIEALKGKHAKAPSAKESLKRVDDRANARVSQGFVVLGYTPDQMAGMRTNYSDAVKAHEADPNDNKHPGMPDEFERRWMNKNKPTRARSKPYELEAAANTCAELMRKAGWPHVRVEEILKG